jgi:hypothetical protein
MIDYFHVIHMAVTGNATDSSVHVNRMVEVDIIGGFVNSNPRHGISCFP